MPSQSVFLNIVKDKLNNGTELTDEEYTRLYPAILNDLTSEEFARLNPNKLYLLPPMVYNSSYKTLLNKLYNLAKKATYHYEKTTIISAPDGSEKKIVYDFYPNQERTSTALQDYKDRMEKRKVPQEQQTFSKETNSISRQEVKNLLKIPNDQMKQFTENGFFKISKRSEKFIYFDYQWTLNSINKSYKKGERDCYSPEKFETIPNLMTVREILAKYPEYDISRNTLTNICNPSNLSKGNYKLYSYYLSYVKIGNRFKFLPENIERFLPTYRYICAMAHHRTIDINEENLRIIDDVYQGKNIY